jgi:transcriptional regulator with XRE-family HTH domain
VATLASQLAETLKQRRRQAGLTQAQMAKRLGISQPTLNKLEHGAQNTTLRTLDKLCRALKCRLGELFD